MKNKIFNMQSNDVFWNKYNEQIEKRLSKYSNLNKEIAKKIDKYKKYLDKIEDKITEEKDEYLIEALQIQSVI